MRKVATVFVVALTVDVASDVVNICICNICVEVETEDELVVKKPL
jgi:hypothetical protein